jgi:hypothetical protein
MNILKHLFIVFKCVGLKISYPHSHVDNHLHMWITFRGLCRKINFC